MLEIKNLLLKFGNFLISEELKKETARKVIFEITQIQLQKDEIEIRNGEIFLKIKPIYRSEIFLKKDQILSELKKTLGKRAPQTLR